MNLFVSDLSPTASAQALDDKRLVKMVLETAQMLCSELTRRGHKMPYRPTHTSHPVVKALQHRDTLIWTHRHFIALCTEYEARFHRTHQSYLTCSDPFSRAISNEWGELAPQFANCARHSSLGLDFSHLPIPDAYRAYLNARWQRDVRSPVWTRSNPPAWRQV